MNYVNENLAELLIILSSFVLSLLFGYIPPLRKWYYDKLSNEWRPGFMALFLLLIGLFLMLLSCTDIWVEGAACNRDGWITMGVAWIIALATNNGTYAAFVRQRNQRINGS